MDFDRRLALADVAQRIVGELQRAVVDSWPDLMPVAQTWSVEERSRAEAAVEAALRGLVEVIAQGDLDEEAWRETREIVYGRGHATFEEVGELLRTVRIVGVEQLLSRLDDELGVTSEERWLLQLQAHTYSEELHRPPEQLDAAAIAALLEAMHAAGPDVE